ncbi:ACP S-malonyltransferase [Chelativorans sp. M5D2P16]|uniref:ACP S-malonyltransferase n=1 Tax=Chelativorans sp. M5D2P16 TaxID=3095678 RepID=UPI002ACA4AEB|nr:ACP S-malonyltransferase [Chelativorans sp. M5D2P16]MDZ5696227.1 ACP S-malonyltransferase [Chelativorans sp. M5D2P16]
MPQAFIFPGQGSQAAGMGRSLAEAYPVARYVFQEVDDALNQPLSRLMFEGPDEELTLSENAQPAQLTVSMAVVRVLEERFGTLLTEQARFFAGHSLGEYSALTAAGALPIADAVRLVRARGRAIQEAAPPGKGAMAAIIGLSLDEVREVAAEAASDDEVCQVANDNAPAQVVVSGHSGAVARAENIARARGAERVVRLAVSLPFHSPLAAPAAETVERLLADIELVEPRLPIVANVTATPQDQPDAIRRRLVEQVTETVRWRESVEFMRDRGVDLLVELGGTSVLTALVQQIDPTLEGRFVGSPRDVEAYFDAAVTQERAP